jgi:thiamine monophosphate kinase
MAKRTLAEIKKENDELKARAEMASALEQQLARMQLTQSLLEKHANAVMQASQALLRDIEALNKASGGQG